jgi:hypothetical protein
MSPHVGGGLVIFPHTYLSKKVIIKARTIPAPSDNAILEPMLVALCVPRFVNNQVNV